MKDSQEEFVLWKYMRYRDPKQARPVDRQIERAGWVGFYFGFALGILSTALLLHWSL